MPADSEPVDHSELPARRVLKANVDFAAEAPERDRLARTPTRRLVLPLAGLFFLSVLGAAGIWWTAVAGHPAGRDLARGAVPQALARPASDSATADPVASDTAAGSRIVDNGCFEVDPRTCLTVNPSLRPALELLRTTSRGPALLRTAADAGVSIRIGTAPSGALAYFRPSTRTVTIGPKVAGSTAAAQAAVVAHELQHVTDWSKVGPLFNNTFNCYQTEASAFTTEAHVWRELEGDQQPANSIERELEAIASGVDSGKPNFWLGLASDYVDECVGG